MMSDEIKCGPNETTEIPAPYPANADETQVKSAVEFAFHVSGLPNPDEVAEYIRWEAECSEAWWRMIQRFPGAALPDGEATDRG